MMNSNNRREAIKNMLITSETPLKGQYIAEKLGVTRQIIVKDIAILRAKGMEIIATPDGYLVNKKINELKSTIIAVNHEGSDIENELIAVIKYGGIIQDVIIEHQLYGEIKAMLMIKNLYDLDNFMKKLIEYKAEPLLVLTNGVHLHTILTENEEQLNNIINELKTKGYLLEG